MENAAFHATYIYSIDFSAVNHFRELYKRIYDGFHLSGMGENLDALWDVLTGFIAWPCEIGLSGISSLSKQRRAELQKILDVMAEAEQKYPRYIRITHDD